MSHQESHNEIMYRVWEQALRKSIFDMYINPISVHIAVPSHVLYQAILKIRYYSSARAVADQHVSLLHICGACLLGYRRLSDKA